MGVCDQNTALTGPAHRLAVASPSVWSLGAIRDAQAGGVRPPTTSLVAICLVTGSTSLRGCIEIRHDCETDEIHD